MLQKVLLFIVFGRLLISIQITMGKSTAGFILYRKNNNTTEYLLLHKSKGVYHWSPPKGHVDAGESLDQAALRELHEETGLKEANIQIAPDFKKEFTYKLKGKDKERHVTYYLAKLKDPQKPIELSKEHQDFKWLLFDEALKTAEYDGLKQLFTDVQAFLNKT